jgi:sterol desaturase/sphingolipid hydroxylase (fatty acid hydroxylase superfamily)
MENFSQYASIVVAAVIVGELLLRIFISKRDYDHKDGSSNVFIGTVNSFLTKSVWIVIMYGGFEFFYQLTPLRVDNSVWWALPVALLVSDFCYYWYHRLGHEIRFLWGIHSIHHSSEDYNLSTAVRLSWLENSIRWVFWIPLPLLGFSPAFSLTAYLIIRLYQVWLHMKYVDKVPLIEGIMTTPSHHRVHHGTNPQYIDTNYAGCLVIWDKLFGTYVQEEEQVVYGILKPISSYNPVVINFQEFKALLSDVWHEPSWKNKFLYLIKKPGWHPDGNVASEEELFEQKMALEAQAGQQ